MRARVDYLFDNDAKARWRIILVSSLAVASAGFIGQSTGSTVRQAQIAATIIGCTIFCLQVLLYTIPARHVLRALELNRRVYLFRSTVTLAASALIAFAVSVSAPTVQAAILNRRLKAAVASLETNHPQTARAADQIFDTALHANVRLRDDLVAEATQELRQQQSADAWRAYVAGLTYVVDLRDGGGIQYRLNRLDEVTENPPICGPRYEGANVAEFVKKGSQITFHDVSRWPRAITSCRLPLDGRTIKNTQLEYLIVEYHGGPVTLENVRFTTVKFQLDDTPNSRKFTDALLHSDNNVLTIHFD